MLSSVRFVVFLDAEGEKEQQSPAAAALAADLTALAAPQEPLFSVHPLQASGEVVFVPAVVLFWWMSRTGLVDAAMGTAGEVSSDDKA